MNSKTDKINEKAIEVANKHIGQNVIDKLLIAMEELLFRFLEENLLKLLTK